MIVLNEKKEEEQEPNIPQEIAVLAKIIINTFCIICLFIGGMKTIDTDKKSRENDEEIMLFTFTLSTYLQTEMDNSFSTTKL